VFTDADVRRIVRDEIEAIGRDVLAAAFQVGPNMYTPVPAPRTRPRPTRKEGPSGIDRIPVPARKGAGNSLNT
jgi:hypothetical protein